MERAGMNAFRRCLFFGGCVELKIKFFYILAVLRSLSISRSSSKATKTDDEDFGCCGGSQNNSYRYCTFI